jgi:pyruvate-formate lyase
LEVDDLELLMGRVAPDRPEWKAERLKAADYLQEEYPNVYTPGQTGHCQLDLSRLFDLGIDGLLDDIRARMEEADGKGRNVYLSFLYALKGLSQLGENAGKVAELASREATENRQYELVEMAEICQRIAHHPPQTFRQALQLLWLAVQGSQWGDRIGLVNPGSCHRPVDS